MDRVVFGSMVGPAASYMLHDDIAEAVPIATAAAEIGAAEFNYVDVAVCTELRRCCN